MTTRFHSGAAIMFRDAWREYKASKHSPAERWRTGSEALLHSWRVFMKAVLTPIAWQALQLYRLTWIKPGGYFFTRAGNRRKRIKEKLRPHHTVTMMDGVERARQMYLEALAQDGYTDDLLSVMLVLSGMIYDGRTLLNGAPKRARHPVKSIKPGLKRWPWPRSVSTRLRALRRDGILTQPDWREARF